MTGQTVEREGGVEEQEEQEVEGSQVLGFWFLKGTQRSLWHVPWPQGGRGHNWTHDPFGI